MGRVASPEIGGVPGLARIPATVGEAAEPDIVAIVGMNAGNAGDPAPLGAVSGRNAAVAVGEIGRPLDDSAGVIPVQSPVRTRTIPCRSRRHRRQYER